MNTATRHTSTRRSWKAAAAVAGLAIVLPMGAAAPAGASPSPAATFGSVVDAPASNAELIEHVLERRAKKKQTSRKHRRAPLNIRALNAARTRTGSSYAYGATGPRAFDCSGLTGWAYARAGKRLPRTSDAQAGAATRVARPRPGDLVFFHNGGDVYHVGLWAGPGKVFHASKPGTPVGVGQIWTRSIWFGRVR